MDSLDDKEITPIKEVEKLARIAGSALNDGVKKHVKKNHMLPAKQGKSYFLPSEEAFVWSLVQQACHCPNTVTPHRSCANRFVLKKKFSAPVGIHGKTGSPCVCVTVIYDIREQRVVTAFPSLWFVRYTCLDIPLYQCWPLAIHAWIYHYISVDR